MTSALAPSLEEAEALLFLEADLLDEGRLQDWLGLYTEDATYWIPGEHDGDPALRTSIAYDDRTLMEDRVWRLSSGSAQAQLPASKTVRVVANVRLAGAGDGDLTIVRSRLMLVEARLRERRTLAARVEHGVRRVDGALRIARKTVRLVDAAFPQRNLTFIL